MRGTALPTLLARASEIEERVVDAELVRYALAEGLLDAPSLSSTEPALVTAASGWMRSWHGLA